MRQILSAKTTLGINDLTELVAKLAVHCRGSSAEEKVAEAIDILTEAHKQIASGAMTRPRPFPTTLRPAVG